MRNVRSLLHRVKRLEVARQRPLSPFEATYGSLEAWEAEMRAGVDAGKLDRIDILGADGNGGVLAAVRRWHSDGYM